MLIVLFFGRLPHIRSPVDVLRKALQIRSDVCNSSEVIDSAESWIEEGTCVAVRVDY